MEENADPEFNLDQLVMVCHDLMSTGSETVATTMNWVILYLALYPEVQEKWFKEIEDTCVTADGVLNDLEKLHYCKATIAEIQRLSQVAPSSIQHRVLQKVSETSRSAIFLLALLFIQVILPTGHVIPEGTLILSNIRAFMTDPDLWDRPQEFQPER